MFTGCLSMAHYGVSMLMSDDSGSDGMEIILQYSLRRLSPQVISQWRTAAFQC
jgi:hypothetical protein